jgi:chemotaxis protein methyltransferase CheR
MDKFEFSDECFGKVKVLIFDLSGINLNDSKREMVYSRLTRVVNKTQVPSIKVLVDSAEKGTNAEKQAFINILTTNKTAFFRESYHFDILKSYLAKNFPNAKNPSIWCSAASTGEEPYTLSMVCHDIFEGYGHNASILATDIDTSVLLKATVAEYNRHDIEEIMDKNVIDYFMPTDNKYKLTVVPELKECLTFKRFNLTTDFPTKEKFDIIFCRNVMIYFSQETQRSILEMFKQHLKPNGLLFAGHSENFTYFASDLFRPIGKTIYCHTENDKEISELIGEIAND